MNPCPCFPALNPSTPCSRRLRTAVLALVTTVLLALSATPSPAQSAPGFLPSPVAITSTVPANGDVNPYGVAVVPAGFPGGVLHPGDILVSNFNDNQNLQGTGTTIVRVPPQGASSLFFTSSTQQPGLSGALSILPQGLILVGSLPTLDGTCATVGDGSLLVINSAGQQVQNIADSEFIQGPWGMTVQQGSGGVIYIFIANAISGAITRFDATISSGGLVLQSKTTIASGFQHRCDPASLFDAPAGLAYDVKHDQLFVASSADNAVFTVPQASTRTSDAGTGAIVYQDNQHLHGALLLAVAPNLDLLVSNNDVINQDPNQPSEIVEFTPTGQFVKQLSLDTNLGGTFGLAVEIDGTTSRFAAVDDVQNTLDVWTVPSH